MISLDMVDAFGSNTGQPRAALGRHHLRRLERTANGRKKSCGSFLSLPRIPDRLTLRDDHRRIEDLADIVLDLRHHSELAHLASKSCLSRFSPCGFSQPFPG
jgi:hypothetical protein